MNYFTPAFPGFFIYGHLPNVVSGVSLQNLRNAG